MSAAARAEARRKAILSRGSDRLAKLTTSARGEDAPAYMHDDPPLPNISRNFVGEETTMPAPPNRTSPTPSPRPSRIAPTNSSDPFADADPSVWSPDQQRQFMQALMGGGTLPQLDSLPAYTPPTVDPTLPPMDNPFAAMIFPQQGNGKFPGATGKVPVDIAVPPPPTRLQKLMPFVHLLTMWCLLAYFVLFGEPKIHEGLSGSSVESSSLWRRWAELGSGRSIADMADVFKIQIVPFFWAFTTLQIVLHSLRIFSGFDAIQPPALLSLALPHLPPPLPSLIVNGLKYWQMGSLFLDDLSGLVVGIGLIVWFSGWFAT